MSTSEGRVTSAGNRHRILLHLVVADVGRSIRFFTALGLAVDERFSDENLACLRLNEHSFLFLVPEVAFSPFTTKKICDPRTHTETFTALVVDSRDEVDDLAERALAAGGEPSTEPVDLGVKYARSFQDLDGHIWEILWMDTTVWEDTTGAVARYGYDKLFAE